MVPNDHEDECKEQEQSSPTRRETLRKIGAVGISSVGAGLGGLQVATKPVAAYSGGWETTHQNFGDYDSTAGDYKNTAKYIYGLNYQGVDSIDGKWAHRFDIALAAHTYTRKNNGTLYNPDWEKGSGIDVQSGSKMYHDYGGEVLWDKDDTYPGYITDTTSTTWSEVAKNGIYDESDYEYYVEQELSEKYSNQSLEEGLAKAAGVVVGSLLPDGVGAVSGLANVVFDQMSQEVRSGQYELTNGYEWIFDRSVPLNFHHVDVEFRVPDGGGDETINIYQEVYGPDQNTAYNVDPDHTWTVTLPDDGSAAGYP
ncbi:hypothetical protein [Haloarchaeobius sp. TZWWS8]|uniref:hypothetical protein n=1 Tax=Haloarchaeobius sp. TZWWS8 TaxID=3446121 RepID=UPI003EBC00FA